MSCFDPSRARRGYSLLEILVALSIVSLILAASVVYIRAPSPSLQRQAKIATAFRDAENLRLQAIGKKSHVVWTLENGDCAQSGQPTEITFFGDGSASGDPICIEGVRLIWRRSLGLLSVDE